MATYDDLPLSECCSEEMPNWPESDICPYCKEHTGILEDDDEDEIEARLEDKYDGEQEDRKLENWNEFDCGAWHETMAMRDHNTF